MFFKMLAALDSPDMTAMIGKTMTSVTGAIGGEEMVFIADDGSKFTFMHNQDCCETVEIEDVCGDLSDLIGSPITLADERVSENATPEDVSPSEKRYMDESYTWTFYEFATVKGSVTVRWLGTSNGYYSEAVSLRVEPAAI